MPVRADWVCREGRLLWIIDVSEPVDWVLHKRRRPLSVSVKRLNGFSDATFSMDCSAVLQLLHAGSLRIYTVHLLRKGTLAGGHGGKSLPRFERGLRHRPQRGN